MPSGKCVPEDIRDTAFYMLKGKTVRLLNMDIGKTGHMSESCIPETGEPMMYSGFLNRDCLAVSMIRELEEEI